MKLAKETRDQLLPPQKQKKKKGDYYASKQKSYGKVTKADPVQYLNVSNQLHSGAS